MPWHRSKVHQCKHHAVLIIFENASTLYVSIPVSDGGRFPRAGLGARQGRLARFARAAAAAEDAQARRLRQGGQAAAREAHRSDRCVAAGRLPTLEAEITELEKELAALEAAEAQQSVAPGVHAERTLRLQWRARRLLGQLAPASQEAQAELCKPTLPPPFQPPPPLDS